MLIKEIVVHAGRKFNHPIEQYSNLSTGVTLTASLAEGDDLSKAWHGLSTQAEDMVEKHKKQMVNDIRECSRRAQLEDRKEFLSRNVEQNGEQLRRVTDEIEEWERRNLTMTLPWQDNISEDEDLELEELP